MLQVASTAEVIRYASPFSRRPVPRLNRGRVSRRSSGGGGAPFNPETGLSGVTTLGVYDPAKLVTVATGVSSWGNSSGGPMGALAQASGPAQPTLTATDATLDNNPTITADGVGQWLTTAYDPPAPGTTPLYVYAIVKLVTFATTRLILATNSTTSAQVRTTTVADTVRAQNGTIGGAVTMTPGTWYRMKVLFSGTAADFLRVGAGQDGPGTGFGNTDPSAISVFAAFAGSAFANASLGYLVYSTGEPTNVATLDTWAAARFPSCTFG